MKSEMDIGKLSSAAEQACGEKHTREFEVGGQSIAFPRLSSFDQGRFEELVRVKNPEFTLAGARNKSAMVMANIMRSTKAALAKIRVDEGKPKDAVTAEDAAQMAEDLQNGMQERFMQLPDKLLGGFRRDQAIFAIAMALIAAFEIDEVTYNKDIDGVMTPVTEPIDSAFVDKLFANESGMLFDMVFLHVTGLSEQPKKVEQKLKAGMSVEEIADETIGKEENSEREQDTESTTN